MSEQPTRTEVIRSLGPSDIARLETEEVLGLELVEIMARLSYLIHESEEVLGDAKRRESAILYKFRRRCWSRVNKDPKFKTEHPNKEMREDWVWVEALKDEDFQTTRTEIRETELLIGTLKIELERWRNHWTLFKLLSRRRTATIIGSLDLDM